MSANKLTPIPATHTRVNDETAELLGDRLLLTSGLDGFADRNLLVTTGGVMGNDQIEIRLVLTAPAMEPFTLDKLIFRLRGWLANALPTLVEQEWVYEVKGGIHPDIHLPCIVVVINDYHFLGSDSTPQILKAASVFLKAELKQHYHGVYLLAGNERLVPLDYQVDDLYRNRISLELSPELVFIRPRIGTGVKYDSEQERYAANYLQAALELALDPFENVNRVTVTHNGKRMFMSVSLECGRVRQPNAATLNAIEATITQVISRHARKQGFFDDLVFVPAAAHGDVDDGDYDEDRGFLGENDEY
jgi:hypothetical protein